MLLKPQDVLVLLHLAITTGPWNYAGVAHALGMSTSAVHSAVKRAEQCGLMDPHTRRVRKQELVEFLMHGLRYVLPVKRGAVTTGTPTAHGTAPLDRLVQASPGELPPIWPDTEGSRRGEAWSPIHPNAIFAARRDPALHEILSLVDGMRAGRARERKLATEELRRRLLG